MATLLVSEHVTPQLILLNDAMTLLFTDLSRRYMRVEQKVHERGFLCVNLWVCSEQSRLNFSEMAKVKKCLAKVLAKVHV